MTSVASGSLFHGTTVTMMNTEPTKNSSTRQITVLVACLMPLAGCRDSADAITAISVPK